MVLPIVIIGLGNITYNRLVEGGVVYGASSLKC